MVKKATMPIDVPQNEKVRMGMLRGYALDVVKEATMPTGVQRSVRELDPVM